MSQSEIAKYVQAVKCPELDNWISNFGKAEQDNDAWGERIYLDPKRHWYTREQWIKQNRLWHVCNPFRFFYDEERSNVVSPWTNRCYRCNTEVPKNVHSFMKLSQDLQKVTI